MCLICALSCFETDKIDVCSTHMCELGRRIMGSMYIQLECQLCVVHCRIPCDWINDTCVYYHRTLGVADHDLS